MATIVDADVRMAELRALNEATQAFMTQPSGSTRDYTKEKYERPEPSFEELTAELRRVDAKMRAAGRYNK
jgi:ribosomal protein S12 methylthiotransferase accessory factor YcaO